MKCIKICFAVVIVFVVACSSVPQVDFGNSKKIFLTDNVSIQQRDFKSDTVIIGDALHGGVIDSLYFVEFDEKGNPISIKNFGNKILLTYNDDNQILSKSFFLKDGTKSTDEIGVFQYRYEYDSTNLIKEIQYTAGEGVVGSIVGQKAIKTKTWEYEKDFINSSVYKGEKKLIGGVLYSLKPGLNDLYFGEGGKDDIVFGNVFIKNKKGNELHETQIITIDSLRLKTIFNKDIPKVTTEVIPTIFNTTTIDSSRRVERVFSKKGKLKQIDIFAADSSRITDENGVSRYVFGKGDVKHFDINLTYIDVNTIIHNFDVDKVVFDSFKRAYTPIKDGSKTNKYSIKSNSYGDILEVYGEFDNQTLLKEFTLDSNRLPNRLRFFDEKRDKAVNADGVHGFIITLSKDKNTQSIITFDSTYTYISNEEGIAKVTTMYDEKKRVVLEEFYRVDNSLIYGVKTAWFKDTQKVGSRFTYDSKGFAVLKNKTFFNDFQNSPRNTRIAGIKLEYNELGDTTLIATFGKDSATVITDREYAIRRIKNNSIFKSVRYYDDVNELTLSKFGYAVIDTKKDNNGDLIEQRTYGKDGELNEDAKGIAIYRYKYENRKVIEESFYNKKESLTNNSNGIAKYVREYDDKGFMTKVSFYNRNGRLTQDKSGFAIYETVYDGHPNKLVKRTTYGSNKRKKADKDGITTYLFTYDKLLRRTSETYLDGRGKQKHVRGGYSKIEYLFMPGKPKVTRYINRYAKVIKEK